MTGGLKIKIPDKKNDINKFAFPVQILSGLLFCILIILLLEDFGIYRSIDNIYYTMQRVRVFFLLALIVSFSSSCLATCLGYILSIPIYVSHFSNLKDKIIEIFQLISLFSLFYIVFYYIFYYLLASFRTLQIMILFRKIEVDEVLRYGFLYSG